jgi:hypothetical protein
MSQRNGDRSRFQINRKRKLRHRQRIRALLNAVSGREGLASLGEARQGAKATKRG